MQTFTDLLIRKEICKNEDREIIIHGLTAGIELILSILTTVLLGLIFDLVVESIVFLISFSFIRMYAGGYHCKKASSCYIMSSATVILVLGIVKYTPVQNMFQVSLVLLLIATLILLKCAPVGTGTKPLDGAEKEYLRQKVLIYLSIECVIIATLFVLALNILSYVISLGIALSAALILLEYKYTRIT